ncbi:molybdate ABC transporter substrate-binding protein [Actinocorallia populi]|uniref:molybdate ABC transporter substrate-binding protein n=1 Tax=Actinocorallia populi TaxID=2079200 RepID=UPI001E2A4B9D|nr:molybdate ABC transporter substrate-binding protein [Actinocorallia populi]
MRVLAAALLIVPLAAGCANGGDGPVTLRVLADSSLTEVMSDLTAVYRQSHPHLRFRLRLDGSQILTGELDEGDVVITADTASLRSPDEDLEPARTVARNSLTIAVAPGNPLRVRGLARLADRRMKVVFGPSTGPLGRYSQEVLSRAGVSVKPRSEEGSARAVLGLVRSGQADAGLVYITDMKSAGAAASSVAIPAAQNVGVVYPAAAVSESPRLEDATAFVDWLASAEATSLFNKYGFQSP